MKKRFTFLFALVVSLLMGTNAFAGVAEKVVYQTKFQDWTKQSASTTATTVEKTTTDGQTLTFTLFNTAVDPEGTNAKFTGEVCTTGYLQTAKDEVNVPYIETSALKSITKLEIVQAATGGTRGITIFVKGDGDADWVELHNTSISSQSGETLSFDVNKTNCQIKIGTLNPKQNGYVLSMKISGNVEVADRTFKNFKVDFRTDPYTVVEPEAGLPEGVTIDGGTFHDAQHGYSKTVMTVPVDGPVKFTIGGCQYSDKATVTVDGGDAIDIDTKGAGCDNGFGTYTKTVTYIYNVEKAATLTFNLGAYCPYIIAEACDYIPTATVSYFNVDGKLIGEEVVDGNSALKYKYSVADVTVPEGQAFRGWFNAKGATATKVAEGLSVTEDVKLYAHATPIEKAEVGTHYDYDMTKNYWYVEDHELITIDGKYYNNHGWLMNQNGAIKVQVAGKCYVNVKNCLYSAEQTAVVTDDNGKEITTFNAKAESDGAITSFQYDGPATTLSITYPSTAYVHGVEVYNVADFVAFDETTGYYTLSAGDAASLMMVLKSAKDGDKIFLPNGTYDFGEVALTTVSANNVSIIGESMEGTIIKNAPDKSTEGIATTATILNTSNNLYIQDVTLQNALDYYSAGSAGRAVCLQDKGTNTICKNVKMLSYQDTYYSNKASKFYWEDSEIHGTVDYLCGDGDVIYNRCKFVNESRSASAKSGSDVLCAPNTSASCTWGYVFLDCSVESKCNDFTFARSWGGNSAAQFVRTKVTDNSLAGSRWTVAGMNIAAYKFMEFGTMDKDGNVTTPSSNIVTFTHSSGNKTYETVLTAAEVENYTVANIFGEWAPDQIAAQVTELPAEGIFLVDGAITNVKPVSGKVRVANGRGGFGPEIDLGASAIIQIEKTEAINTPVYNIAGQRVSDAAKGVLIKNGRKFVK